MPTPESHLDCEHLSYGIHDDCAAEFFGVVPVELYPSGTSRNVSAQRSSPRQRNNSSKQSSCQDNMSKPREEAQEHGLADNRTR